MRLFIAITTLLALVLTGCADPTTDTATTGPAAATEAPAESSTETSPDTSQAAAMQAVADAPAMATLDAPIDFRGTWVLNTDRGENLGMMKAVNETIVATQTADRVTFDMTDKFAGVTTKRIIIYDLNGTTMRNKAAMGADSETVTQWDGDKLVTTWSAEGAISGTTTVRNETRWLSDAGKTLSVSMVRGDNPAMVFVFEKAE